MKHRNVEKRFEFFLDDEAVGSFDVFEVDTAKRGTQIAHRIDERLGVGCINKKIDGVDVCKAFE